MKLSFFLAFAIGLAECIIVFAFAFAGWKGLGAPQQYLTDFGEIAGNVIFLTLMVLLVARFAVRFRKGRLRLAETAVCVLGFAAGILLYVLVDEFNTPLLSPLFIEIEHEIIGFINAAGWLEYRGW